MKQLNITGTRNRQKYFLRNLRYDYDKKNDLLYVYKNNSNIYSNVIIGEFHLEFTRDGDIAGIEILNASELLKEYDIPKRILENIDKVDIKVINRKNSLLIFLIIHALNEERSATITMNNIESPIMKAIATT